MSWKWANLGDIWILLTFMAGPYFCHPLRSKSSFFLAQQTCRLLQNVITEPSKTEIMPDRNGIGANKQTGKETKALTHLFQFIIIFSLRLQFNHSFYFIQYALNCFFLYLFCVHRWEVLNCSENIILISKEKENMILHFACKSLYPCC